MPEGVDFAAMMDAFPVGRVGLLAGLGGDSGTAITPETIDELIAQANASH